MEKVTIKDIAKVANVSYATVSRALSGSPEIGEATRERILKICNEMKYIPDSVARSMVKRRTNILGLVTASINNPFMSELIEEIEITARERGYNLMVCNSSYDAELEKRQFSLLLGRRVDGIIIIPVGHETSSSISQFASDIPTVYVSESLQDTNDHYVSVDNVAGGKIGVEYLKSKGHERILYLGRRPGSVTHKLRSEGVIEACKELGVELQFQDNIEGKKSSSQVGYELASKYFENPGKNTAIFCASDALAIGVMQAADEKGVRIPEDVSILGFDNISFSALPRIGLTTIAQKKKDMAEAAVKMILDMVEGAEGERENQIITPVLIERTSCRGV